MGINTIIIDCDGCLTDGKKYVGQDGRRTAIAFNSRDNTAIQRLIEQGYRVIIVTASHFPGIRRYWGKYNLEVFSTKQKENLEGIDWDNALGIGDDVIDIPFLRKCAAQYVPSDAHPRMIGEFTPLATRGGRGIMEEVETRLKAIHFSENGKTKYVYGTAD